jgi:pimeloyl-ACP methyl ester carboxylesterase
MWTKLVNLVIRPPRADYDPERHLPGPRFKLGGVPCHRTDLELTGALGLRLRCSHYRREDFRDKTEPSPCVIYLHGNSGSRCDATNAVRLLLPMGIDVFALDFGGSGLSEGEHVSLGAREKTDVAAVIEHLRTNVRGGRVGKIGLWGTSMGAVTALLAANEDPSIAGIVLDSPFASLRDLMAELVEKWTAGSVIGVPRAATKMAAGWMRSSIKSRASFDIDELEIERVANATFCPALFAHGDEDDFIDKAHSARLREKYAGDSKPLLVFDGDHNSPRPAAFFDDVELFFRQTMWETPAETSARRREEAMNDARRNGDTSAPSVSRAAENTGVVDARSSGGEKEKETNRAEVSSRRVASSSPRRNAQQRDAHRDTVVRVRDVLASPGASPPERREALGALKSMGFESPRATYALRRAGGDLEEALAFLLDDDDDFLDSSRPRARDSRNDDDAFVATDLFAVSDAGGSAAYEASALVASDASDADLARALALSLELADAEARAREGE